MIKNVIGKMFNKGDAMENLQVLVDELHKKGTAREAKINETIKALTLAVQDLRVEIYSKTQELVDAEINEDKEAQDKLNKAIRELGLQLSETENKISVYQSALKSPSLSPTEIEKLKGAVVAVCQDRQQKAKDTETKIQAAYDQIQALNDEITKMEEEKRALEQPKESFIAKPVMKFIHPEFKDPKYETMHGEYQYIFDKWLNGNIN
ncbi:MAG: hypothetical protein A4E53_01171 [Pelotomaculum sp. PtaB.Bin104]|nr:MAG: hypothetical protein A4E53_01171 [Pelotomaculum sp. PtaB.Bin104]